MFEAYSFSASMIQDVLKTSLSYSLAIISQSTFGYLNFFAFDDLVQKKIITAEIASMIKITKPTIPLLNLLVF
jgi:hypothetical protein